MVCLKVTTKPPTPTHRKAHWVSAADPRDRVHVGCPLVVTFVVSELPWPSECKTRRNTRR